MDLKKFGASYDADRPTVNGSNGANGDSIEGVDKTYKLYYGGAQKRPDGNYSMIIRNAEGKTAFDLIRGKMNSSKNYTPGKVLAQVGQSNRKDVRNAVECAVKAQPGWAKRSPFNRQQILFYIAENLEMRKSEFASRLSDLTGKTAEEALKVNRRSVSLSRDITTSFSFPLGSDSDGRAPVPLGVVC